MNGEECSILGVEQLKTVSDDVLAIALKPHGNTYVIVVLFNDIYIYIFFLYFETTHYAQLTVSRFTSINQSIIHFKSMLHEVQWTVQCYDLPIQLNTYIYIYVY